MEMIENLPVEQLPRVTVLIATHNYGEYLSDALDSSFDQDYKNKSIVVVDDASTDDTQERMDRYMSAAECQSKDYPEYSIKLGAINGVSLMYIRLKKNVGPSEARNVGIEVTKDATDIYAILDADDFMHHQKLSRCVVPFLMSQAVGVVYADYDNVNTETLTIVREYKEPFSRQRLLQECIVHSGALVSKAALEAVKDEFGYYDREMRTCEDYDLWIRISEKFVIIHVPEPLTIVRVQPKNSTVTVDKSVWERNWQRIAMKLQAKHEQPVQ